MPMTLWITFWGRLAPRWTGVLRLLAGALLWLCASQASAITITVCASGCDFTKVTAAIGAAGASDIIQINNGETITEAFAYSINSNFAEIRGQLGTEVWDGNNNTPSEGNGSNATIRFNGANVTQTIIIRNLTIAHTTGASDTVRIDAFGSGGSVQFIHCTITSTSLHNPVSFN
ncbi:MAG: hypothetical protein V4498_02265, partial [candidate division FCPU426 bacterium]